MSLSSTSGFRYAIGYAIVSIVMTLTWTFPLIVEVGNAWRFVVIGTRFANGDPNGSTGYDGQFSYYIARDGIIAAQPRLDNAAYRLQRILHPVLGGLLDKALGLLTGDQQDRAPYTLLALNVLAVGLITGALAVLLGRRDPRAGNPVWLALLIPIWIGTVYAVRLGLNEPLCMAFGLTGLAILISARENLSWRTVIIAAICLTLSMLAKDMGIVFIAAGALWLWRSNKHRFALVLAGAVLPYLLWFVYLRLTIVMPAGAHPGTQFALLPFASYLAAASPAQFWLQVIWLALPALIILIESVRQLLGGQRDYRKSALWPWLGLCAAFWTAYLPPATTYDLIATYRVALPLIPAGLLLFHDRRQRVALALFWAVTVLQVFITPGFFRA